MRIRPFLVSVIGIAWLLLATREAHAFGYARQGVGLGIGSGTIANGLSVKWMTGPGAIQGVVGFWGGGGVKDRFSNVGGVAGSVDYLFEMPTLTSTPYFTIDWSFGLGAGIGVPTTNGKLGAAVSAIAGLEFNFTRVPLDFVVELRPSVAIIPDAGLPRVSYPAHLRLGL